FLSAEGEILKSLEVGYEPDMLTFSPDGRLLLVANEGEPESDYKSDPPGSISLIDVSNGIDALTQADVVHIGFEKFDSQRATLDSSIRIFGPGSSVSQ